MKDNLAAIEHHRVIHLYLYVEVDDDDSVE